MIARYLISINQNAHIAILTLLISSFTLIMKERQMITACGTAHPDAAIRSRAKYDFVASLDGSDGNCLMNVTEMLQHGVVQNVDTGDVGDFSGIRVKWGTGLFFGIVVTSRV
ncbi:MAG: hypothetical protein ACTSUE_08315 [Promethearchaeota archaeon]